MSEHDKSDRDTHFYDGFTRLLVAELEQQGFITPVHGIYPYRLIARRAYDLAYQVVSETVGGAPESIERLVAGIPDLTEWPEK